MNNNVNVLGVSRDNGACSLYRVSQPLTKAHRQGLLNAVICGVGHEGADIYSALDAADAVLIPRVDGTLFLRLIEACQKRGKKIVLDYDDDVFNVNPFSPHYFDYGANEVVLQCEDGSTLKLWEDGKERNGKVFDVKRNRAALESIKQAAGEADAITVTTSELRDVFLEFNPRVHVLPNFVDFDAWRKLPGAKSEPAIKIGWQGGCSHYEDWMTVIAPLTEFLREHKNCKFVACGENFSGLTRGIEPDQFEFHPWVPTPAHPYKQATLMTDIAILPLKRDNFNSCKSPIKYAEYAALGIACLAEDFPPYNKVVTDGYDGILYKTEDEFYSFLELLVNNIEIRGEIGANAEKTARERFDAGKNAFLWAGLFNSVVGQEIVLCP